MTTVLRDLREDEVEFEIELLEEDVPVRGNFASDEPEEDRKMEDEILRRLEAGDQWAWCCVKVVARWNGFEAFDILGCCSYESEKDFKRDGYWEDMKAEALRELNEEVRAAFDRIDPLVVAEDTSAVNERFSRALAALSPEQLAAFGEMADFSITVSHGESPEQAAGAIAGRVDGTMGYTTYYVVGSEEEALGRVRRASGEAHVGSAGA